MNRWLTALALSFVVLVGCGSKAGKAADPAATTPATFEAPAPTFTPSFAPITTTLPAASPGLAPNTAAEPAAPEEAGSAALLAAIDTLIVADETHADSYSRDLFGGAWIDADRDGCNTRCEVLKAEQITLPGGKAGWLSLYDNYPITNEADLDIDHMIPLAEAWRSGAWSWDGSRRIAFANDLDEPGALIAVTAVTNRAKGDRDPGQWKPANVAGWCEYVDAWVATKRKWELTADTTEVAALREMVAAQNC